MNGKALQRIVVAMVRVGLFSDGLAKNGGVSVKYGNVRQCSVLVECSGAECGRGNIWYSWQSSGVVEQDGVRLSDGSVRWCSELLSKGDTWCCALVPGEVLVWLG